MPIVAHGTRSTKVDVAKRRELEGERREAIAKIPPTKEDINNRYLNKIATFHSNDCYCGDCTHYRGEVYRLTGRNI